MTLRKLCVLLVIAYTSAEIVDLSCSDDALCIDHLTRDLVRGLRQRKTVRLFDSLTIEPVEGVRQARSNQGGLAKFLTTHAISFDWDDYSFRFTKPTNRNGVIEMDVFQGRAVDEDDEELVTKKGPSGSDEKDEPKPKRRIIRRRHSKRIMQAILPMMVGMKSASTVILAISAVAALTMKAFLASKLALLVTVSMAAKKLYESFGQGVGLQNHPYLYSQYPIDFPSASSHAYSVSGLNSQQFPSSDIYSPTALASHTHHHEMLQQGDIAAQQSAPALQVANATRASERWDGKSKLLNMVKPIVDSVKSVLEPIAGGIVKVMPESFRAITSKAFGLEQNDELENFIESRVPKGLEIEAYKPKLILIPKPRQIERNMVVRTDYKLSPKKIKGRIINLSNIRDNKNYVDYVKTKKYNYNYDNTRYYPKIRYISLPYKIYPQNVKAFHPTNTQTPKFEYFKEQDASPLTNVSAESQNGTNIENVLEPIKNITRKRRDILNNEYFINSNPKFKIEKSDNSSETARGISDILFNSNPMDDLLKTFDKYVKTYKKKPKKNPIGLTSQKIYYVGVEMVRFGLQMFDVYMDMSDSILMHLTGNKLKKYASSYFDHKPHKNPIKYKPHYKPTNYKPYVHSPHKFKPQKPNKLKPQEDLILLKPNDDIKNKANSKVIRKVKKG